MGCRPAEPEDTSPPEPVDLIDAALWAEFDEGDDPLAAHRPDEVVCNEGSWYPEYSGLEINTSWCNYLTLTQPLGLSITAGEPLGLLAWHQSLLAEEAATAHMALLIDGVLVWEINVPIPANVALYESTLEAPADASAGAPVVLHLHNHGYNSWQFDELTVLR